MAGRVVVTGSSGGIGGATAARLASDGFEVVGVDRAAGEHTTQLVDLGDADAVRRCCGEIVAGGPLFGLVYTAGRNSGVAFADYTLELWSELFAVNVTAAFLMSQALAPVIEPGGGIVMIVSGGAYSGSEDVGYSSSKTGQLGLMKSLAKNLPQLRVNAISPGPIDTPMLQGVGGSYTGGLIPRLGQPEEIAVVVSFLLAQDNTYMTGATIDVNGGIQIR